MLKQSASFVLASLRGSTYRSVRLTSLLAAALFGTKRVSARMDGRVRNLVCMNIPLAKVVSWRRLGYE
jgi:hypothetical protein